MDTFNPNQMPPMPGQSEKKSSMGPLVAVIIILALIVVAGLYFLKTRTKYTLPPEPTTEVSDSVTTSLKQQGTTDDLNSIEADLKATDVNNLDQGAAAVDALLQ